MVKFSKTSKGKTPKSKLAKSKARVPVSQRVDELRRKLRRIVLLTAFSATAFVLVLVLAFSVINPPTTHTIWSEKRRLGDVDREWVPLDEIAPVMARAVVAAEDARFCMHWGFDVEAIRSALEGGAQRGASTLTQQVVKNVFLWQHRSWVRKAFETVLTPIVEAVWTKRRIVEVYLNVAEMGNGIFGVEAAAWNYFGKSPADLTAREAAIIAAILPSPRERSAEKPSDFTHRRAAQIMDGAATIDRDGRAACFQH